MNPTEPYRFMKDGKISPENLKKIIQLTEGGIFVWDSVEYGSLKATPVGIDLHNQDACERMVGENLRGIEFVWNPSGNSWYYIVLKSDKENALAIRQEEASSEQKSLLDELFKLAKSQIKI